VQEALQILLQMPPNSQIKLAIKKLRKSMEQPIESLVNEFELN
jgi:hypothetical protein